MKFGRVHPLAMIVLLMAPGPRPSAEAREQAGARSCSGVVSFGEDRADIRLMQVSTKSQRLPFYRNRTDKMPQCPAEVDACRSQSFLVQGDLVLVGPGTETFGCAHYIAPNARIVKERFRETVGFVPLSEVQEIQRSTSLGSDWHGTWRRSAEAEIRIEPETGGRLKIRGSATFGALDPERSRRGAVNAGELEGTVAQPRTAMIALGDGWDGSAPMGDDRSECRARLRLFAPYLVVEDNGGCGGANVSFTGVYIRLQEPARP